MGAQEFCMVRRQ